MVEISRLYSGLGKVERASRVNSIQYYRFVRRTALKACSDVLRRIRGDRLEQEISGIVEQIKAIKYRQTT